MAKTGMKDSRARKRGNSIRTKLITVMLLLTAVPLLLALIISYVSSMNNAEENAEEMNLLQASLAEDAFIDIINQSMRAIQAVAGNPGTRDFVKLSEEERAEQLSRMAAYLASIDGSLGDTNSTVISDASGANIARSRGDYTNIGERDYFLKAMGGTVYLSDVIVSKTTGSRIIVPSVPIYDDDGVTVIGVVTRNFNINVLHDDLAELAAGSGLDIFITDRDGNVVADSAQEITADDDVNRSASAFFTMASSQDSGTYIDTYNGSRKIVSFQKEPLTDWIIVVTRSYDDTMTHAMRSALIQVIVGIVALIIACVIAFVMANSFVAPIFAVNGSLRQLSEGVFERISDPKYKGRKDEFGDMIQETNSVIDKLDEIVSSIKESAASVGASSQELADTTNQISQTADDVSNAVQEIATGATQQAEEIQHATENTGRISDNILDVSNNANGLEGTAKDMSGNSRESVEQLQKLRASSEQMQLAIDDISEKIGATSRAVANINSKVDAINNIASQTNLLALNASIEAARAGDAGKGFAVVAEEIGKLASDSAQSANEIRSEMDILLSESQAAVEQAVSVRQTTEEQSEILTATVESVNKLINDIGTTVDGVNSINSAAALCSESKTVVVDAMSSLSAISEENAAASEETSASMQELNATVNTLAAAADGLRDIADRLNSEMAFFK